MQLERPADGLDPDLSLDATDAVAQFTELESRNVSTLLAPGRSVSLNWRPDHLD